MPAESDKIIREKISGIDVLPPGIELNSAATWRNLEYALHPAKKRAARWYFAAAAFLGVVITLLILNKDHNEPVKTLASKKMILQNKPTVVAAQKLNAYKKITANSIHLKKTVAPSYIPVPIPAPVPVTQTTNTGNISQLSPVAKTPVNTALLKPVMIAAHKEPVKPKRLRIVHLNELSSEPEIIYTRAPLKKMQMTDEMPDEPISPQINKAWWQPKPKPVITITDQH